MQWFCMLAPVGISVEVTRFLLFRCRIFLIISTEFLKNPSARVKEPKCWLPNANESLVLELAATDEARLSPQ